MKKKLLSLALALALCLGLTVPAFAAELKVVESISCKYYQAGAFSEGLAAVQMNNKWGFVDKTGKEVIPLQYDGASFFSNGLAAVEKNSKWGFIDKNGKEIISLQYSGAGDFCEGLAAVLKNGKIGYIDTTGKEVIPCTYDDALGFLEGLAKVKKGGKWGFIDQTDKEVISFQYDDATSFFQGLAGVKKNGKWGCIDKTGEVVVDFQYDDMGTFANGLAAVLKNGKWGYINKTGEIVIPCKYDGAGYFREGLAMIVQNDKCGYIDTTGKLVVPCKYDMAGNFSGGFAPVNRFIGGANTWGYIDKTGKEVVPCTDSGDGWYIATNVFTDGMGMVGKLEIEPGADSGYLRCGFLALTVDAEVSGWAREQVDSAAANGLMPDGLGNDFTVNITRAEFAALAVKLYEAMSGDTAPAPGDNPFSDTSEAVIIQANALGIVNGVGDGKFAPSDLVTREQAALMLSRVYTKLGGKIPEVAATTFADNGKVSSWARDAVAFMSSKEIVNGVGNNNFDPQGNASIEQAMVIALRMFENLK